MKSMIRTGLIIVMLLSTLNGWAQNHVVVLGGGGGASQTLKALEKYIGKEIASLTGVINNSDDGGSTGALRQAYGTSAVGDLGKCQLGLAHYPDQKFVEALDFRWNDGPLKGQSLRNVMMAALELQTGNINTALEMMGQLLQINSQAKVVPISSKAGTVRYRHGEQEVVGQFKIAEQPFQKWDHNPAEDHMDYVDITQEEFNPEAKKALLNATHIILAPGNVYATILPLLATPGLVATLKEAKGQFIVVTPLFNRLSAHQTNGWTVEKHLEVYQGYLEGKKVDVVVMNSGVPEQVPTDYEMVVGLDQNNKSTHWHLLHNNFLENHEATYASTDVIKRSPIRHDIDQLAETIVSQAIKK